MVKKDVDKIFKETLQALENGKNQIFDIAENTRSESDRIKNELDTIQEITQNGSINGSWTCHLCTNPGFLGAVPRPMRAASDCTTGHLVDERNASTGVVTDTRNRFVS